MPLIAAGISFRTAPLEVRERVALADPQIRPLLRFLIGHGGLRGVVLLSTCNRTELYASLPAEARTDEVLSRLCRYLDPTGGSALAEHMAVFLDEEAALHLFRVAAGLESMVVGEAQVLAQVRAAHRLALEAGSVDAPLDFLFRRAAGAGRRVRRETAIGKGAGSLSEAAVTMAAEILGGLQGRTVLLIGAGKMNGLAARRLRRLGAHLRVTSRGGESAAALAGDLGATVVTTEDVAAAVVDSDLVITSTSSSAPVLDVATVAAVQRRRGGRRLCIVDIAVPRDVEPAVTSLPGVVLVDIDELGRQLDATVHGRREAAAEAETLVRDEARRAMEAVDQRDAADPTIRALVERAEEIRKREVARTLARLPDPDAATVERIDRLSRSLVRKLLHAPITHLRDSGGDPGVALRLRQAFDLDGDGASEH
ncbi:MAG: glutamyl-tRNA reductase [Candidatus Dormiibacterota bacterium]